MDSLPIEILQLICKYTGDISYASLRCLALVNKDFYYAALPRIYECAAIKFHDFATLKSAVNEITSTSRWKHFQVYLRRLDILTLPETWSQVTMFDMKLDPARNPKLKQFVNIGDYIPDAAKNNLPEESLTQWRTPGIDLLQFLPSYYKERDWQPLVKLLSSLNRLEDLNYAVANNFPGCLLQALHQYHLTCRLSIWTMQNVDPDLRRPGSIQFPELPGSSDPFETELFRSPCLHAIRINILPQQDLSDPKAVLVEEGGFIPLVPMAPNLRHLQVDSSYGNVPRMLERTPELEEFMTPFGPFLVPPLRLTSFICRKTMLGGDSVMDHWGRYFDFANLRALDVGRISNVSKTVELFSRLRNLERLLIDLDDLLKRPSEPRIYFQEADFWSIFGALGPLKYLRVRGLRLKAALQAVLEYHGESLRGLSLEPNRIMYTNELHRYHSYLPLALSDILDLAKKGRYIRDLRLTIERSEGNYKERLVFEAFRAFPALQNLTLDLHCKPRPSETPPFRDSRDSSYWVTPSPELEKALINAAMDETLAKEIWDIVYSNQQATKLLNLHLVPIGWDLFTHTERDILFELSRSFLISKHSPEFDPDIIEIGRGERRLHVEREAIANRLHQPARSPPQHLRQLLQSLWGLSDLQMENWILHWRSFPLDP